MSANHKFIWLGDIDDPKAYEFLGPGGFYFANTGCTPLHKAGSNACLGPFHCERTKKPGPEISARAMRK